MKIFGNKEITKQRTIDTLLVMSWIECLLHSYKGGIIRVKEKLVFNIKDRCIWDSDTENFINQELNKVYNGEYYG